MFYKCFSKCDVIIEICKGDLRLDHPELTCMSRGIGIFCTEGRSKGIHITETKTEGLHIELSTYGEIGRFSKKLCIHIWGTIRKEFCFTDMLRSERKHFSSSFCIRTGNDWCMHIGKSSSCKKFMYRLCYDRTDSERSHEGICTRTKMRNLTEILKGMSFLLDRIGKICKSDDGNRSSF